MLQYMPQKVSPTGLPAAASLTGWWDTLWLILCVVLRPAQLLDSCYSPHTLQRSLILFTAGPISPKALHELLPSTNSLTSLESTSNELHIYVGEAFVKTPVPLNEGVVSIRSERFDSFSKLPGAQKACIEFYIEDCVHVVPGQEHHDTPYSWGRLAEDEAEQRAWRKLNCNRVLEYMPKRKSHLDHRTNLVFAASDFLSTHYDVCMRDREIGTTTIVVPALVTTTDSPAAHFLPDGTATVTLPWISVLDGLPRSLESIVLHGTEANDFKLVDLLAQHPGWQAVDSSGTMAAEDSYSFRPSHQSQ